MGRPATSPDGPSPSPTKTPERGSRTPGIVSTGRCSPRSFGAAPTCLCSVPDAFASAVPQTTPRAVCGWPSPRTWERTAECLAAADAAEAHPARSLL